MPLRVEPFDRLFYQPRERRISIAILDEAKSFIGWHGHAKEMTLHNIALLLTKESILRFGLCSFSHHLQSQAMCQADRCGTNRDIVWVALDI